MKKLFFYTTLPLLLFVGVFLFTPKTNAETNVSGIISEDTTWTLENSPYIVIGNILVEEGVTLIIEPGVIVKFNEKIVSGGGYYMKIDGALVAEGTEDNKIIFTSDSPRHWGGIRFSEKSIGWDEETNMGSIIKNSIIEHTKYERIYSNYLITISDGAAPLIANNILRLNNLALASNGNPKIINNKIYDGDVVISGSSYFFENEIVGGGLHVSDSSVVSYNNIINSPSSGIWISINGNPTINYNNIVNSGSDGIVFWHRGDPINPGDDPLEIFPTVNNNNIFNNKRFAVSLYETSMDIDVSNNWWGTTATSVIDALIYDHKNDYNLGQVIYEPFLTEPETGAPPIDTTPPSNPEAILPEINCTYSSHYEYLTISWTNPIDKDFNKTKVYRSTQYLEVELSPEELNDFVNCLKEKGMVIYGADWCPYTVQLIDLLGGKEAVGSMYIDCEEQQELCQEKGIMGYPTILINDNKYKKERTLSDFAEITGCEISLNVLGDLIYEGRETQHWFWYEINQTYYYTITAVDFWGNESSGTQFEILIPSCFEEEVIVFPQPSDPFQHPWPPTEGGIDYHILTLEPGWNIISTPRVLLNHEFSVPSTVDNFDIYLLDPTSPTGWQTMQGIGQTEFQPLFAYFVNNKTGENQTLRLNYDFDLTPAQRLFQRTLHPGWNIIGIALPEETLRWGRENKNSWHAQEVLKSINESIIAWVDFTANQGNINSLKVSDQWNFGSKLGSNDLDILSNFKGYGVFVKEKTDNYIGFQDITDFSVKEIKVKGENDKTNVREGQLLQMIAEVFPIDASDKSVTWSVINDIGEANIDENGLLAGISEGTVTVRATANDGSGTIGELEINVILPPPPGELELSLSPENPKEGIVIANKTSNTEGVELLRFELKVEKAKVTLNDIKIEIAATGVTSVDQFVSAVHLYDGTTLIGTETIDALGTTTFTDLFVDIDKDQTKTFTVKVDVRKVDGEFANEGAILVATVRESGIGAKDANYEQLSVGNGTITGGDQPGENIYFYVSAPVISNMNASISPLLDDDNKVRSGRAEISFRLTAQGGEVNIATSGVTVVGTSTNSSATSTAIAPLYQIGGVILNDTTPASDRRISAGSNKTITVQVDIDGTINERHRAQITVIQWRNEDGELFSMPVALMEALKTATVLIESNK